MTQHTFDYLIWAVIGLAVLIDLVGVATIGWLLWLVFA
jgi:hypothetical protein